MWSALLDAFGDLLRERGYADLTLAEVAARAGMARNTIYNYAPDKEALLMACIGRAVEEFVAGVRAETAGLPNPRAKLALLIRRQMHEFLEQPGGGTDNALLDGSALSPGAHQDLQVRFQPLYSLLAEIVQEGVAIGDFRADIEPEIVVPMIFAVMGSERTPVGTRQQDPDLAADRATEFVLHALS